MAINFTSEFFQVSGRLDLNLFDFIVGGADFVFTKQTLDVDVDGGGFDPLGNDIEGASLVVIAVNDLDLFVGADGIGFEVTGGSLAVATIKGTAAGDTRSFLAVKSRVRCALAVSSGLRPSATSTTPDAS